jgi:hypothetical protein
MGDRLMAKHPPTQNNTKQKRAHVIHATGFEPTVAIFKESNTIVQWY